MRLRVVLTVALAIGFGGSSAPRAEMPTMERVLEATTRLGEVSQWNPVKAVAWSADGSEVLAVAGDVVTAWSLQTGRELWRAEIPGAGERIVAFAPDRSALVVASDRRLEVYGLPEGLRLAESSVRELRQSSLTSSARDDPRLPLHAKQANLRGRFVRIAFGTDGTIFAGTSQGHLCSWEWATTPVTTCSFLHQSDVSEIVVDPAGRPLYSASWDELAIWRELDQTSSEGQVVSGRWGHLSSVVGDSAQGGVLAFGSAEGKIWVSRSGSADEATLLTEKLAHVTSLLLTPEGSMLISGDRNGRLDFWSLALGESVLTLGAHRFPITDLALDPRGQFLASGSADGTTRIWAMASGEEIWALEGHARQVSLTAASPKSRWLAVLSIEGVLAVWNLESGSEETRLVVEGILPRSLGEDPARSLAIDTKGEHVALGHQSGTIHRIALAGRTVQELGGDRQSSAVSSLTFDPSRGRLLAGSRDGHVTSWELENGDRFPVLETGAPIVDLALDGSSQLLVLTQDRRFQRWDLSRPSDKHPIVTALLSEQPVAVTQHPAHGTLVAYEDGSVLEILPSGTNLPFAAPTPHRPRPLKLTEALRIWVDARRVLQVERWNDSEDGFESLWSLVSGARGLWVGCNPDGWCRRKDDGTLLVSRAGHLVEPLAPNTLAVSADAIEIAVPSSSVTVNDGESTTISVRVSNRSTNTLYWLGLARAASSPADSLVFLPPPIYRVLEPGQETTLVGRVAWKTKGAHPKKGIAVLSLELLSANGGSLMAPAIEVQSTVPALAWRGARWDASERELRVELENVGKAVAQSADATLRVSGMPDSTKPLGPLASGEREELVFGLPPGVEPGSSFDLVVNTRGFPPHGWEFPNQSPKSFWQRWSGPLFLVGLVLVLAFAWQFWLRYIGHPFARLVKRPKDLLDLPANQLREARLILDKLGKLDPVLRSIGVRRQALDRSIDLLESRNPSQRATRFADFLEARVVGTVDGSDRLFRIRFPETFPVNLGDCLLALPEGNTPGTEILRELRSHYQTHEAITFVLAQDLETQKFVSREAGPANPWVALSADELTRLFLASDRPEILAKTLPRYVSAAKISPYKSRQGVKNERMFFGREELLTRILGREPTNYLVVGSRKVGKSSLLHAIHRRLQNDPDVACHFLVLNDHDLVGRLASLLKIPGASPTLSELRTHLQEANKRHLFLIDEVDPFVKQDLEHDLEGLQAMRSLSEEGLCFFVLAGFWEVFSLVQKDYKSPVKNFGELIRVGALEPEACSRLSKQPMERLGIRYQRDTLVDRLIQETGRRPNLICIVCDDLVKRVGVDRRPIGKDDLEAAFECRELYDALEIGALDKRTAPLDRIVTFATVGESHFSLADLVERLRAFGLEDSQEDIEASLGRLELAGVLRLEGARYTYQVPLYRKMLLERDPDRLLADAVALRK